VGTSIDFRSVDFDYGRDSGMKSSQSIAASRHSVFYSALSILFYAAGVFLLTLSFLSGIVLLLKLLGVSSSSLKDHRLAFGICILGVLIIASLMALRGRIRAKELHSAQILQKAHPQTDKEGSWEKQLARQRGLP
jgi:hypothetical protein